MKNSFVKAFNNPVAVAFILMIAAAAGMAVDAAAFTAPVGTDMGYVVYDIAFNQVLNGPIGFVAAMGMVAYGIFSAVQVKMLPAALGILGGGVLFALDSIVTGLGYTI